MSPYQPTTPLISLDAVALDTETTGLDARTARIVEVAALRLNGGRILSEDPFHRLVNPGVVIPATATEIHGLAAADVGGAPGFAEVAEALDGYVGRATVIGHNIGYDLVVLAHEYALAGRGWRARRALDVGLLARVAAPTLAGYSLDALCDWLGVHNTRRHRAMPDARAAAEVFAGLIPLLRARNIRTLAEAEAACDELHEQRLLNLPAGRIAGRRDPGSGDATRVLLRLDSFPYRHRVRDVMSAPPVIVPDDLTPRQALDPVLDKRVSSVLVAGSDGRIGIVTERDLLRALRAEEAGAAAPLLASIMSHPLQTVPADAFIYRAIGRMDRLGIRHLAVLDQKAGIVGVVTASNLLRHRASAAIALGDEIDVAPDVPALGAARAKLPWVARSLLEEEVEPANVAAVISAEICAFTARASRIAEQRLAAAGKGAPPVPYAVLVLGSAGRGEGLLAADQDNAIVYAAGAPDGPEDRWFAELGDHMADALDQIGVPYCRGGVMAKNAGCRHSVAIWRQVIDGWIEHSEPVDLLNVDIFFDGVAVHGDAPLADGIFDYAHERAHREPRFAMLLASAMRGWRPPLTVFGNLRQDQLGRIDLKKGGLLPIFTGARALAIRHDIRERPTAARLRALAARGVATADEVEAIIDAHQLLLGAVLEQQLIDAERGVPPSNDVEIDRLGPLRRQKLADAVKTIGSLITLVNEGWA